VNKNIFSGMYNMHKLNSILYIVLAVQYIMQVRMSIILKIFCSIA